MGAQTFDPHIVVEVSELPYSGSFTLLFRNQRVATTSSGNGFDQFGLTHGFNEETSESGVQCTAEHVFIESRNQQHDVQLGSGGEQLPGEFEAIAVG